MTFNLYGLKLLWRVAFLATTISLFIFFFNDLRFHAATLLMFAIVVAQGFELWHFINFTNRELNRFLAAIKYNDFAQEFDAKRFGSSFAELGNTFNELLAALNNKRAEQEQELIQLRALVEHTPVPLLSIQNSVQGKERVLLRNNAARRLFSAFDIRSTQDLAQLSELFFQELREVNPGEKKLVRVSTENFDHHFSLTAAQINTAQGAEKLIGLQDIRNELERNQLQAWQDLVNVLTHEIMNSITPVASLADTTAALIGDAKALLDNPNDLPQKLEKAGHSANTLARRSQNLVQFVSSYRSLTALPEPQRQNFALEELVHHVIDIVKTEDSDKTAAIDYRYRESPKGLTLSADRSLMEQAFINLLRNARQAINSINSSTRGIISIEASVNPQNRVCITIQDNGPGIDLKVLDKIFIPYFTTKVGGSGIGLALARQILIAHEGTIKAANRGQGGVVVSLII